MLEKDNRLNLVAVILMFITTIISLFFLPDTVINHFNGIKADQTGSKYTNLIVPIVGLVLYSLGTNNLESKFHIYSKKLINMFFVILAELNLWWTYLIFHDAKIEIPMILWIVFTIAIPLICIFSIMPIFSKQ